MRHEKKTEEIKVHLGEKLKVDLKVEAAKHGFTALSPFIHKILTEWAYGHQSSNRPDLLAEFVRDE